MLIDATAIPRAPSSQSARDERNASAGMDGRIEVLVRARSGFVAHCLDALGRCGIEVRTLSIMREASRPGWRRVTVETWPGASAQLESIARELGVSYRK